MLYWRNKLSFKDKDIYDKLKAGVSLKMNHICVGFHPDMSNIGTIYSYLILDNPQLYYLANEYTIVTTSYFTFVDVSDIYSGTTQIKINRKLCEILKSIPEDVKKDPLKAEYWIICYISQLCTYEINDNFNQNTASILYFNKGQCSGFSSAFKYLMDKLGFWCISVVGTLNNNPHQWNMVKIGEQYYHVDVTSCSASNENGLKQDQNYAYFNVSNEKLKENNFAWDEKEVPICKKDMLLDTTNIEGPIEIKNINTYTRLYDLYPVFKEAMQHKDGKIQFRLILPSKGNELKYVGNVIENVSKQLNMGYDYNIERDGDLITVILKY